MRSTAAAVAACALCAGLLWAMPVVAGEEPKPPVAFSVSPNPAQVGQTVGFQALAGDAGRYRWDLDGDGSFETDGGVSPTASRTYAQPGSVNVGLLVTDRDGDERQAVAEVVVASPEPEIQGPPAGGPGTGEGPGTGPDVEPDGGGGEAAGPEGGPDSGAGGPGADGDPPLGDEKRGEPSEDRLTDRPPGTEKPVDRGPSAPRQRPAPRGGKGPHPLMPSLTPRAMHRMPRLRPVARIASTSVQIQDFAFSPASITVQAGETVTWTNRDDVLHSAKGRGFDTNLLRSGETGSHTFTRAGTYSYICVPHKSMKGTVRVAAAGGGGTGGDSGGSGGSGGGAGGGDAGGSRFSTDGTDLDISGPLVDETTGGGGSSSGDGGRDDGGSDLPTTGLDLALLVAIGLLLLTSGALLRRAAALRPA